MNETETQTKSNPAPDYIPTPEDLSKPGATVSAGGEPIEAPLIDNKDVEQDIRPVYVCRTSGKLQGAFWHRRDGNTALSIRFAWECTGDSKSMRYEAGKVTTTTHPAGELISEFRQIRDDGKNHAAMSDAERISMETIGKYYLCSVIKVDTKGKPIYTGPGGSTVPAATLDKWQQELCQEGLRAASKDIVMHRCVSDMIGKSVLLVLAAAIGQSKVLDADGQDVLKANGKPQYQDDPDAPKRQKIQVQSLAGVK